MSYFSRSPNIVIPIFNPRHDPAEASRMQSSTRRKVNQNVNRLADRGFFIERLSTAEYKASSGLEKKDGYLSRV
jgi:hypothetical protein